MSSIIQSSGLTGLSFPNTQLQATASAGALTVSLLNADGSAISMTAPAFGAFRSSAGDGGQYEGRAITSVPSVTLSVGSDMGNSYLGYPNKLWVVMMDNAPSYPLALINCRIATSGQDVSIQSLVEDDLISAVADGGAGGADTAGVFVASAALSSKPFRIVGSLTWETTGGAQTGSWAAPDKKQMYGLGVKSPGMVVREIGTLVGSVFSSATNIILLDNSPPLTSEGNLFRTLDITPSSGANIIESTAIVNVSPNAADTVVATLCRVGDTNAYAVGAQRLAVDTLGQITIASRRQAGGTSTQTHNLRIGSGAGAGAGGVTVNGVNGVQVLSTSLLSGHRVRELVG